MKSAILIDNTVEKREYFPLYIKVMNKTHFYNIAAHLNDEFGKGMKYWTNNDRVLKSLKKDNKPVDTMYRVYADSLNMPKEEFDAGEIAAFLILKGGKSKEAGE